MIIKELRKRIRWNQAEVAAYLKCGRDTYSKYERDPSLMTVKDLLKLCELFKTTPNVILDFEISTSEEENELEQKLFRILEVKLKGK